MEGDDTVNIMIVLSQKSSIQFQVMINTTDVTAVGMLTFVYIIIDRLVLMIMFLCIHT